MIQYAYDQISKIIKETEGYTLQDYPRSLQEMINAFDNIQHLKVNGCVIIYQFIEDTKLWFGIIKRGEGVGSPKHIVASNNIACFSIRISNLMLEALYIHNPSSIKFIQPKSDWLSKVIELLKLLKIIEVFCVVPETRTRFLELQNKVIDLHNAVTIYVVTMGSNSTS